MSTTKNAGSATETPSTAPVNAQDSSLHASDALQHHDEGSLPAPPVSAAVARASAAQLRLLDRDHSILAFNERVFHWVGRKDVPLLERLRYLCIVSSNLDEFFEVRAEPHITAARTGETKG